MNERVAAVLSGLGLPPLPEPLPVAVIDSHTHAHSTLEFSGLAVGDALDAAALVGVAGMVEIGCDVPSSRAAVELAAADPRVVASVAMHPNDAARVAERHGRAALDEMIAEIDVLAGAGRHVRAVGETGLDFYRTRDAAGQEAQRVSFEAHIAIAKRHDLTLVIHDRDAHAAILEVLDSVGAPERVIMHCFSGDATFAAECASRGFWLSFPGVVTFPSAGQLREALLVTPRDRLLVETDAPYLTPVPTRGRPNSSYLLPHTVRNVSSQLDADLAGLCDTVRRNTEDAYGGPWGDSNA
ncbi:MAG TPA: TatD family hydrolase [Propionibacteriaceae bacterium]|nr:TatD family hydrolase [Propionibacteriaceae bacterium]